MIAVYGGNAYGGATPATGAARAANAPPGGACMNADDADDAAAFGGGGGGGGGGGRRCGSIARNASARVRVCLGAIERASTSDEWLLSASWNICYTRINNKYCGARTRRRFAAHRDARLENLQFQCECSRWRRTWRARDRAWCLKMSRRRPGRRRV